MDLSGDFGTFLRADQWPPFHIDGIPGSPHVCGMVDVSRAFAPCDHASNPSASFQPQSQRAENDRLSRHVRAGLLLLLASCGWIVGGDEGVRNAVARGTPPRGHGPENQNTPRDHFPIRTLASADAPELFAEIDRICWRAKLPQRPRICVLVGQRAMNAYAFGGPNDAIVTFTEGLLRGMTTQEVGAIFAHEIAHICNDDSATMSWAAQLQRAINDVAAAGLAPVHVFCAVKQQSSLQWVLMRAPAIAELLMLALSRFREIEADAFALELTGDAKTLETALAKLEHHHRALSGIPEDYIEDRLASYLRSHPVTSERIGHLRASPLYGAA